MRDSKAVCLTCKRAIYHPNLNLPDYAIAYQSGSIYMLLVWWVKQDYVTPLAELTAYAEKHIML